MVRSILHCPGKGKDFLNLACCEKNLGGGVISKDCMYVCKPLESLPPSSPTDFPTPRIPGLITIKGGPSLDSVRRCGEPGDEFSYGVEGLN